MKKLLTKTLLVAVCLLVGGVKSAWGDVNTTLIDDITLPSLPTGTYTGGTDVTHKGSNKAVVADNDGNSVMQAVSPGYGNPTGDFSWTNAADGTTDNKWSTTGVDWDAPSGSLFVGSTAYTTSENAHYVNFARRGNLRNNRTFAYRFTNCGGVSALVKSQGKTDAAAACLAVYEVGTGSSLTPVETVTSKTNAVDILTVDELSSSKTYVAYIYGMNGSNGELYEVAFLAPSTAKTYTVTAATNNPTYGTAVADASSLDENETTEITAYPNAGYQFVSWSVQGEGSTLSSTETNPTTLTMGTANTTVTATFSAINYDITHGDATGGTYTISVDGGEAVSTSTTATIGQTVTLAGTPNDPANTYVKWNVTDDEDNEIAVINNQFTMPAKDVTIAPVFSKPLNTLFSMTNITGITNSTENNQIGSVTATISEGGAVEVFNNKGNADGLFYNNSINLNGSSGNYIHISFPTKLVAGDEISATFLADGQDWKISKTTSGAAAKTNPYTLTENDAFIGATELYFFKNSGAQITELYVKGVGQLSDLEVTSSATPTVAIDETSNIEISTSSTGAVTYTSSDTDVATVSATGVITGVDGGEATITIEQAADANYRAGVKTITVTVPAVALLKIKTNGGTSTKTSGTASFTADVNLSSNKKMDRGRYFGFTFTGDDAFQTGDVVEINITAAGQNGTFKFYDSKDDNPTELYDTEVAPNEAKTYKFIMPASMNGVKTVYLRRGGDGSGINEGFNPVFDYVAVYRPDAVVTLNASGFSTYSAGSDFTVVGATPYKMALNVSEGTMTGAAIDGKIPAGAGVLLKGEAGAIVSILNTTGAEALTDNSLHGTTDANGNTVAVPEGSIYVLKGDTFKPYTGETFASNKAFFQLDKADESRTFTMIFEDGETTGVGLIDNGKLTIDNEAGAWYSIQGVRHDGKPSRSGLYIFNGKKVVIK